MVGRRPLLWFFLFACALSWPMALTGGVNPLAPALAALLVLGLIQGRQGLRLLLRRAVINPIFGGWACGSGSAGASSAVETAHTARTRR